MALVILGDFIQNNISADADYLINDKKVEITLSNNEVTKYFHQKVNKVNKYIKDETYIVFVNRISV